MAEALDFSNNSVLEIIDYFNFLHTHTSLFVPGEDKDDYYCGITSENEKTNTLERHQIESFLAIVNTGSQTVAAEVEEELGKEGYDIGEVDHGGNGGNEDSILVYMFKKTRDTVPSI